jgi:DNA-binding CsgD family transcriptional regulator
MTFSAESAPDVLPVADVAAIVRLLGELPVLPGDLLAKKRRLVEGLAEIVGADAWLWTTGRGKPPDETPMLFSMLHGGHGGDQLPAWLGNMGAEPLWEECQTRLVRAMGPGLHATRTRGELAGDAEWYGSALYRRWYESIGLDDYVLSVYFLPEKEATTPTYSALGYWRRAGRPPFSGRDRCVVHVVFSQIDWLHRAGTDVPAADDVLRLSPRQRQVLILLLGGDSRKQVARKLGISEHTVTDYMKALHRHFNVSSRGELLAKFMAGDAGPDRSPAVAAAGGAGGRPS